jgi:hypothetical protein
VPSSSLFVLEPLARKGERGFRVTHKGDETASSIRVEWEYEAVGTSPPRTPPFKDRIIMDFAPRQTLERWFAHSPDDGMFYVLVAGEAGAPDATFELAANPDEQTPEVYRWES